MTESSHKLSTIELSVPSELGYEKVVRDTIAAFARRLGFDNERIDDLKTAIGEACINAIEHGNGGVPDQRISVSCICEDERLTVEVRDRGVKPYDGHAAVPSIEQKLQGIAPLRGMGLMLIAQLVDEADFTNHPAGGNLFRLSLYRRRDAAHP
ncbi:MAG TPA: ATP-binding protein [Roseiflexaceae bacterium]|nr:ATP-binding protein [Roseiflexaceae bacterium]HMP42751.1 ATP-binding protein [Roseiflexaceae bacterium]